MQPSMVDTWSYRGVVLTPTIPPPPPSSLTQRTLFNRILRALTPGRIGPSRADDEGKMGGCSQRTTLHNMSSSTPPQHHCPDSAVQTASSLLENRANDLSTGVQPTDTLSLLHQHDVPSQTRNRVGSAEASSLSCQPSVASCTPCLLTVRDASQQAKSSFLFGETVKTQLQSDCSYHKGKSGPREESASDVKPVFSTSCTGRHSATHTADAVPGSETRQQGPYPRPGSKHGLKQAVLCAGSSGALKWTKPRHDPGTREGTPYPKKSLDGASTASQCDSQSALLDVRCMDVHELKQLEKLLTQAAEIAATLVFSDGSTQLRETQSKKAVSKSSTEVDGVCLALPVHQGTQKSQALQYLFLPLDPASAHLDEWCRTQLLRLMRNARVICFDGQEIISILISHFQLEDKQVCLSWHPLDTRLGAWLLDPDHPPQSFSQLLSGFNMQLPAGSVERDESRSLVCKDLALLGPLMVKVYRKLQKEELWSLFSDLETRLIPILSVMEVRGIGVNCDKLLHYADLLKHKISQVEARAHKTAGRSFSINSTVQLRQVLFDELHLDEKCGRRLSKTQVQRQKSTSEAVLTQLQDLHPLPALVLEYRQLCKMNSTYVNGILPYISEGILKPCWQHTGAATGRLASCNPNIQAFPKLPIHLGVVGEQYIVGKTAEEVRIDIREAVESRPGFTFLAADFKSIELRLLAHLSEDPVLIDVLNSRQSCDVFALLASEWLAMKPEEVTQNDREKTKRVVYAVVYGVGKEKLAEILNIHPSYAKELTKSFLAKFPGVQAFTHKVVAECRQKGCLSTICKRKRWFPHIDSSNIQLKLHADRQAVNFPVQGSAADICKFGMLKVVQMLAQESPRTKLLLQIHDELLFEVPDKEIESTAVKVKALLESTSLLSCALKVPLEVRITAGKTWATLLPV